MLDLLAAEVRAVTGADLGELYRGLASELGTPFYERLDAPASRAEKDKLKRLDAAQVTASQLAGEEIVSRLTRAPGNGEAIGGLKVSSRSGWFAVRPSGTEDVYKLYAESFKGPDHLREIQADARKIVSAALGMV